MSMIDEAHEFLCVMDKQEYADAVYALRARVTELEEVGRRIRPEHFLEQYFAARDVVNRLKAEFGKEIHVDLLMKNNDNSHRFYKAGVDRIDNHIPEKFDRSDIARQLGLP